MKYLTLSNSQHKAIIDDEDYWNCFIHDWILRGYIVCVSNSKKYGHINLANYVKNTRGILYDHKDRNHFNNQKENLRIATVSQNYMNRPKQDNFIQCSSKYKGVCFATKQGRWMAQIRANKVKYFLGYFQDEQEAARAYDRAAIKYHGEFACLNFPRIDYS